MAKGVNKVILIGNLGDDPKVSETGSCTIANLSVATSDSWNDKKTGQKKDVTEWHRVVFFNKLAEIARDHLHKGSRVYIEGSLKTRKWTDKNGVERYTTEITGKDLNMLSHKDDKENHPISSAQLDDRVLF